MKIGTKRLVLRRIEKKDIPDLIQNINNLKVSRYLLAVPYPYTLKDAKWWIAHCKETEKEKPRKSYSFNIESKAIKKIVGGIGLIHVDSSQGIAEVGYWLGEKYWRQGIMSEALNAILNLAFEKLKLRRINLLAFKENKASNALARNFGFKYEGRKRKAAIAKSTGKIYDENIYGLLKEEWKRKQGKRRS
ncbi:GNAT family N-acetyltransferase [Candidatus Woesearchaeota archaeon]|nr:GNAT family N-acetyltransferase [Candidatus Woesearchaeota archaeon]